MRTRRRRSLQPRASAAATSPGRLQLVGTEPTVLVDAAHNPHGPPRSSRRLDEYFDFDEVAFVFGVLADKDVAGIVDALARRSRPVHRRPRPSPTAPCAADELGDVRRRSHRRRRVERRARRLDDALDEARAWAAEAPKRAVVVTGSIALVGEAIEHRRRPGMGALDERPMQPDPTPDTPDDAAPSRRARRARAIAAQSLAAIVLGFEALVVFLAALVIWGLAQGGRRGRCRRGSRSRPAASSSSP